MLALETRRLLAPSLAPRLTRPGILNTTWKPLTSAAACCSAAFSIAGPSLFPPAKRSCRSSVRRAQLAGCSSTDAQRDAAVAGIARSSDFKSGALAAARGPHGGNRERDIRPVLAGVLRDFGAAHQFERGLAVFRAGVETGVVERHPARVAHRIGHPQRRFGRGGRREFDPDFQLARRLLRPVLFEPRDFAVEFALLALGIADRSVGAGDFLADRGKGRAPFGDRPRLTLVADPCRRRLRKALGEFAPGGRRIDRALQVGPLVLQRLDALVEFGQIDRRRRARRFCVDRADGEFARPPRPRPAAMTDPASAENP